MSSFVTISLVDSGIIFDLGRDNFNIEASIDDILYHFHGFSVIQFSGTLKFTIESSVGLLVSKDESQKHICGNIVPLTALERMCQEALTHKCILAFFQVCRYFFPNLSISAYNKTADDMVSIDKAAQFPAHTLWPLLVLAEVFETPVIAAHCRNLLRQRVASGGSSEGFRKLFSFASCPDAVSAFTDDTIAQIASRLETHFSHFGEDAAGTPLASQPLGARSSVHAVSSAANIEVGTQCKEEVPVKTIKVLTPTPTAMLATSQLRGEQLSSMFDDDESPRPALRTMGAFSSPLRYRESDPVRSATPKYSSFYGSTDNEKSVHSASSESHLQNSSQAWRHPSLHAPADSFSTPKRSSSPPLVVNSRDRVRSVSASRSKSAHRERERDRADPLPTSPPLSEELLQKSREVAVLRLMEVRAKEELALARHLNDREMCANRLRVLELRAEAARYSSAKGSSTHQKSSGGGTSVGAASAEYSSAVGAGPNSFNVKYPRSKGPVQSTPVQQHTVYDKLIKSPEANRSGMRPRSVSPAHRTRSAAVEGSFSKPNNPGKNSKAAGTSKSGEKVSELGTASRPRSASRPLSSSRVSDVQQIGGGPKSGVQSGQLVDQREAATSPEEARQRARERIAVARRRMKVKEQQEAAAQQAKLDERFAVRNRKIALYKERQRIPESVEFITADSAPYASGTETGTSRGDGRLHETDTLNNVLPSRSPSVARVNESSSSAAAWSLLAREERRDAELQGITQSSVHPRLYSSDALAAVGLGLSPSYSLLGRHRYGPERTEGLSEFELSAGENTSVCSSLSAPSEAAFSPHGPHQQSTDITVRVLRANDLPECLGGTNAYVTLDWSGGAGSSRSKQSFGIGTTHHVPGTTDPEFDATLKFRSPFTRQAGNHNGDSLSPRALGIDSSLPVIRVLVFSKNASISDELVAVGELSVFEVARENYLSGRSLAQAAQDVHSLQLVDLQGRGAGTLDVTVEY